MNSQPAAMAAMVKPDLAAQAIGATKLYGMGDTEVRALDDVSVDFERGRFTAVMGPSGSGKSTLMHCLAGLDTLTSGKITVGDTDLSTLNEKELTLLRRRKVGFIFQAFNLIPTLTADENINLPNRLAKVEVDGEWFNEVVSAVGLADRLTHKPDELSGGQQQRVAVARALASRPDIIFADEPTGNLDSVTGTDILDFMGHAVREFGQTIVMVTHDVAGASHADNVLFLADGKIVDQLENPTADSVLDKIRDRTLTTNMLATLIGKNLLQRPLRYVLTGLSIAFGVAAVVAVFIFTDGLRTTFEELSSDIESGYDIAIKSDSPFGNNRLIPPVPLAVLDVVSELDGVAAAQPRIIEFGVIAIDAGGEPVLAQGPNIGLNWESRTPNPRLFVQEGREPTAAGEFAIDIEGFADGAFTVGDTYAVLTPTGSQDMKLVGSFTFASEEANASIGAGLIAFEENEALRLLNGGEGYDDIVLVVDGDSAEVMSAVEALIANESDTLIAIDQEELLEDSQGNFDQILTIFQTVLLVFAVIILIVSVFLIFNVFTITLGQRVKELGLLRSIGALGSQVTSMMLGEALLLGAVATIIGLPAGWLLARALRFGLSQFGFPGDSGLPVQPQTILYAVFVGIVVTILAALFPSIRARRVTPIVALREG